MIIEPLSLSGAERTQSWRRGGCWGGAWAQPGSLRTDHGLCHRMTWGQWSPGPPGPLQCWWLQAGSWPRARIESAAAPVWAGPDSPEASELGWVRWEPQGNCWGAAIKCQIRDEETGDTAYLRSTDITIVGNDQKSRVGVNYWISSGPDDIWSPPEVAKILLINVCKPLLGRRKCWAGEAGPGRRRGGLTAELLLTPLTRHIIRLVVVIVVIKLVSILFLLRLILLYLDYFIAFKYLRARANAWNYWWLNSCR